MSRTKYPLVVIFLSIIEELKNKTKEERQEYEEQLVNMLKSSSLIDETVFDSVVAEYLNVLNEIKKTGKDINDVLPDIKKKYPRFFGDIYEYGSLIGK